MILDQAYYTINNFSIQKINLKTNKKHIIKIILNQQEHQTLFLLTNLLYNLRRNVKMSTVILILFFCCYL